MENTKISFAYHIKGLVPASTLQVTASCNIGRSKEISGIKLLNVAYVKTGERFGSNVDSLLKVIAPEIYNDIIAKIIVEAKLKKYE